MPPLQMRLSILEREVQTGANQTEIIVSAFHNVPAQIARNTDVMGHAHFESAAELASARGFVSIRETVRRGVEERIVSDRSVIAPIE